MKTFLNSCLIMCSVWMFLNPIQAQVVDSVFMNMPEKICPLLNKQIKFEMLEYFKAGQKDSVSNRLNGFSAITFRDTATQTIHSRLTSSNDLQIKLFNTADNKYFIGLIETIYSPIVSSELKFYDADWRLVEFDFPQLKLSDYLDAELLKTSFVDSMWLKKVDEFNYCVLKFQNDSPMLKLSNHSLEIMNKEDKKLVISLLNKNYKDDIFFKINTDLNNISIEKIKP